MPKVRRCTVSSLLGSLGFATPWAPVVPSGVRARGIPRSEGLFTRRFGLIYTGCDLFVGRYPGNRQPSLDGGPDFNPLEFTQEVKERVRVPQAAIALLTMPIPRG